MSWVAKLYNPDKIQKENDSQFMELASFPQNSLWAK